MKTLPLLSTLALTLGLGFLPALAQATPAPPPPAHRMGPRLQLTEAQKAGIRDLRLKHRERIAAAQKTAQEARKAFAEAARKPETAKADLQVLHRALADQAFELRMAQRALRLEIRALLTPEQREQAARMEGRMEARMHSRMQEQRMGRRGGWMDDNLGH